MHCEIMSEFFFFIFLIKVLFFYEIDKIVTVNLKLTTQRQIYGEDFVNFVTFLENMNFT